MRIVIKGIGKPQQNTYDGGDDDDDEDDDDSFVDKHNHVDHIKRRQLHDDGAKQQMLNDQAQDEEEQEEQDQQNEEAAEQAGQQAAEAQQEQEQQKDQDGGEDGGDEDGGSDDGGDEDGGDDEGDEKKGKLAKAKEKIDDMKGAFSDWKNKRKNKKKLKKLKRKVKLKEAVDNSLGPYHKNMIPERHAKQVAAREKDEIPRPVTYDQKQLLEKFKEKQELGKKIQNLRPDEAKDVDKLEAEYKKKDEEVKEEGRYLMKDLLKADIRRAMEGPTGCWKDCKAAFLTMNAIAICVIGGIIAMVLGLCGVF